MWMSSLNSLQNTLLNSNMYVESLSQNILEKIFLRQKRKITITKVMWMGSLNSLQNTLLNNNMYVESLSQKWCEWTGWIQKWCEWTGWIQLDTGEKHSGKISLHLTSVCCVQFWKITWRTLSSRCYKESLVLHFPHCTLYNKYNI